MFEAVHAPIVPPLCRGDHRRRARRPHRRPRRPQDYCTKLRARLHALERERPKHCPAGPAYFIVEKILPDGENLPQSWGTDGTTGYDFMDEVSALQHDGAGDRPLTDLWERVSGRFGDFGREEEPARPQILQQSFSAQLGGVVRAFYQIAQGDLTTCDIARLAIHRVLTDSRPLSGLSDLRRCRARLAAGPFVSVAGGHSREDHMLAE